MQIKRRGLLVLHLSMNACTFYGLHETKSPSMALMDLYPFGSSRIILAKAFIAAGRFHNILLAWLGAAMIGSFGRYLFLAFAKKKKKKKFSRLTGEAESHPVVPKAFPTLCPRRAVEKNPHNIAKNHARAVGGGHLVFREPQRLF